MSETLRDRIRSPGPKRILSLDGGGIRGLITLGFLERIEDDLKSRLTTLHLFDRPPSEGYFRLRDYYDLIGGTSTGAIIAAALGIGMSVRQIIDVYMSLGTKIFGNPDVIGAATLGLLVRKFDSAPLKKILESILGKRTLGDPSITTGLCIVAKRFDTNSLWPIVNAPDNTYYDHDGEPNKDFLLSQIVRASTAAPTFFDPEYVTLGKSVYGFIDGGISMHNNPALQLLLVATLPGFGFSWSTGKDKLSITSIGTGEWSRRVDIEIWRKAIPALQAGSLINMFMEDASRLNETMLQAMGAGTNRRTIDSLTGQMDGTLFGPSALRYERFQAFLEPNFFDENGLQAFKPYIPIYQQMDNVTRMRDLLDIGRILAERDIKLGTLP